VYQIFFFFWLKTFGANEKTSGALAVPCLYLVTFAQPANEFSFSWSRCVGGETLPEEASSTSSAPSANTHAHTQVSGKCYLSQDLLLFLSTFSPKRLHHFNAGDSGKSSFYKQIIYKLFYIRDLHLFAPL